MADTPRHEAHGEDMQDGMAFSEPGGPGSLVRPKSAVMTGSIQGQHCCSCWTYTDDQNRETALAHEAVLLLINGTPSTEQTEAHGAAVAYLAARFKARTGGSSTTLDERFRL
jgi:hypothetical protein